MKVRSIWVAAFSFWALSAHAGPAINVNLGTADSFAVLAATTVTNTGPTIINGNLGVWPGTAVTGFPPGIVTGGTIHAGDTVAMQAQTDKHAAYTFAAGETGATDLSGQDLGGLTLTPGVYKFSSSAQLTGTLTLNAQGDPNAVFLFQIGSTLTTASASDIDLINGAQGDSVFWQVGSSATLGTTTDFAGNILALTSITLNTGATILCGRALADNGAVTLDSNIVSIDTPGCETSPVGAPEPASLVLLGSGLLGLGLISRRRKQPAQAA
jgi:Ice-binding-like/PEP-CTERM motif